MLNTMSHTKRAIMVFILYVTMVSLGGWTLVTMAAHAQPMDPVEATSEPSGAPGAAADADSDRETPSDAPLSSPSAPAGGKLVLVVRGDTAPFTGLLLHDFRYAELKSAELRVNDAEATAKQEKRTREDLETVLNACLLVEKVDEGGLGFWAGMAIGVGSAILVGWLGYEIIGKGD